MIRAILKRTYKSDRTLGQLTIFDDNDIEIARYFTLENPWKDNQRNISCIPEGTYTVVPNHTKAHPDTYRVLKVENRSGILIHIGNYPKDTHGCILVGLKQIDLDKDGVLDIAQSTDAIESLYELIGEKTFKLTIQ